MASREATADAALDPSDPYARSAQTFPRLSPAMAARVAAFGREERLAPGALVFERGQRAVDFFLVLEGAIEILDGTGPEVIHIHGPSQFTGELDLFNDRRILVSGRATEATRAVRVRRADFRRMVAAEPEIGEIIMRAFILRRVGLMLHAQGGVVVIGPGHAADTVRIQRFLSRNGYPLRMLDTDLDPDAGGALESFHVGRDQLPVVISDGEVLRNPTIHQLADRLGLSTTVDPEHVHDFTVVGAGPAGLATAVYAASEGLDTLILEGTAPGGQAGTSSKIENYLGLPTGISGQVGLAATMSSYLVERIAASPRITLHVRTEITALAGEGALERVTWRNRDTRAEETYAIGAIFVMIGAEPNTDWLDGCLQLDAKGFVISGDGVSPYATSRPGVYAVGDVRSGSVKRVASGVGEGSVVVQAIHRFLDPASP